MNGVALSDVIFFSPSSRNVCDGSVYRSIARYQGLIASFAPSAFVRQNVELLSMWLLRHEHIFGEGVELYLHARLISTLGSVSGQFETTVAMTPGKVSL